MDKYTQHLNFLITVLPEKGEATCQEVFLHTAKRDVRKALFFLFQPQESAEELLKKLSEIPNNQPTTQIVELEKILHSFCPNASYTNIVGQLSKGKPLPIDTETLGKLKAFRRAPRKEFLQELFKICADAETEVLIYLLDGLLPFGREVEPFWNIVDNYAKKFDTKLARTALDLLAQMPTGVHKSISTFSKYCTDPKMRFHALSAMQQTMGLSPRLLATIFDPILSEYRRLCTTQGTMNDLWEEFRLIRNIAQNNGLRLSIPDINLGRF